MQHWFGHCRDGHKHVLYQVEGGAFPTTSSSGLTSGPPSLTLSTGIKRFPCRCPCHRPAVQYPSRGYQNIYAYNATLGEYTQLHTVLKVGNRIVFTIKPNTREDNVNSGLFPFCIKENQNTYTNYIRIFFPILTVKIIYLP